MVPAESMRIIPPSTRIFVVDENVKSSLLTVMSTAVPPPIVMVVGVKSIVEDAPDAKLIPAVPETVTYR